MPFFRKKNNPEKLRKVLQETARDTITVTSLFSGKSNTVNTETVAGQLEAYSKCSVVKSIISKKSAAFANAKIWALDANENDIQVPVEMARFMAPNPMQDMGLFAAQAKTAASIFGRCYVWKYQPYFGLSATEYYILQNQTIRVVYKERGLRSAVKGLNEVEFYEINIKGEKFELSPDEVFEISDFLHFESRLKAVNYQINTLVASYDAALDLLAHRGALGILSMKSAVSDFSPKTQEEKDIVLRALSANYGIKSGQDKSIVTHLDASYSKIGADLGDLGLNEIQQMCKRDIADLYGMPSVLLDVQGTTFSNVTQAAMSFYTDTIIPEARFHFSELNRMMGFGKAYSFVPAFDHLEMFQEAKRAQAAGLNQLAVGITKLIEARVMLPEEARKQIDKFLVE